MKGFLTKCGIVSLCVVSSVACAIQPAEMLKNFNWDLIRVGPPRLMRRDGEKIDMKEQLDATLIFNRLAIGGTKKEKKALLKKLEDTYTQGSILWVTRTTETLLLNPVDIENQWKDYKDSMLEGD
ncbi:MAG: hypothetical protein UU47_C0014G0022 [candidate division TM6 bacterium GW2011_GWE2_41_16]|nr:MAG: hypothetical protein UU47_C0014G0022 [candidate division TM6 bacterium GW2011_GWE2_41_16]